MYWSRLGDLPYKLAVGKICNGNATPLDSLYEEKVFDIIDGTIFINFLSEQLNEFENTSNTNRQNAIDGWEKRRKQKALKDSKSDTDATALPSQSEPNAIRGEEIREDDRKEDEIRKDKNKSLLSEKKFSEEVIECYDKCLKHFPEHLHPKSEKQIFNWQDTVEKLIRIDNIPTEKIIELVKCAREDDFWCKIFLSLPKLRTKDKNKIMYVVVFNEKFKTRTRDYSQVMRNTAEKIKNNPDHIANHLKFS
jgi:hypothetical protein